MHRHFLVGSHLTRLRRIRVSAPNPSSVHRGRLRMMPQVSVPFVLRTARLRSDERWPRAQYCVLPRHTHLSLLTRHGERLQKASGLRDQESRTPRFAITVSLLFTMLCVSSSNAFLPSSSSSLSLFFSFMWPRFALSSVRIPDRYPRGGAQKGKHRSVRRGL